MALGLISGLISPPYRRLRWMVPAGSLALVAACGSKATDTAELPLEATCSVGQGSFSPGESFVMDCNTCTCEADGSVSCDQRGCAPATCSAGGTPYAAGDTFAAADGCNTCECGADGSISCTERDCPPMACVVGDRQVALGQDFTTPDECGVCTCEMDGTVSCSSVGCGPTRCALDGVIYEVGETFLSADTCNTCTCTEAGIECTDMRCVVAACDGFAVGERASNGCNSCTCTPTGFSICTTAGCRRAACGGPQEQACDEGQFCDFPPDANCGDDLTEGRCSRPPEFCPIEVVPVCGCDNQTYDNACRASQAGVSVAYEGACGSECSRTEPCPQPGCSCQDVNADGQCEEYCPVFACERGQCVLQQQNGGSLDVGDSCGSTEGVDPPTCRDGLFCQYPPEAACGAADATGECASVPALCVQVFEPVCGCDGQTYSSECHAALAQVSILSTGACE